MQDNIKFPKVINVIPQDDYTVKVFFEDGKVVLYDMKPNLSGKVFRDLRDIGVFKEKCTVLNDTLAWDMSGDGDLRECVDIDVFTLYERHGC
ncbi:MAG: DUF2442 domain-containing protein [Lachnospiraceae bacterium]|nr:DUF2442 domain-containing protein [Lachnospiraceae bacterium]